MENSDYIIDLGPEAGNKGGEIVAEGSCDEIKKNNNSITGRYLSNKSFIPVPKNRRLAKNGRYLEILNASGNNLKNVNLKVPLGAFTCVTGVSGSGKSTLILQTLFNALNLYLNNNKSRKVPLPFKGIKGIELIDKIIDIDQSPIGRTPRSNPATYTGAFGPIRDWFTNLPESKRVINLVDFLLMLKAEDVKLAKVMGNNVKCIFFQMFILLVINVKEVDIIEKL